MVRKKTANNFVKLFNFLDICNAVDFGLFYQALPSKTIHLKKKKYVGGKFSEVTLIQLAAGNDLGRKLPMFAIGKENKPKISNVFLAATGAKLKVGWTTIYLRSRFMNGIDSLSVKTRNSW